MKAVVFSDLHLAYSGPLDYELALPNDADVVILAGDITAPVSNSIQWAHRHLVMAGYEVILVAGNHEHYGQCYEASMAGGLDKRGSFPGVHFLENEQVVIGGVRFLGATLWTDFNLYERPKEAMKSAFVAMNDYRAISSVDDEGRARHFIPELTAEYHAASLDWLAKALAHPFAGPTVVVTHHAPHLMSVAPEYAGDPCTPAFVSDLSKLIEAHQPEFWIHGHVHSSFDYEVPGTRTRVVCNPRGYVRKTAVENSAFEPFKTIEIPV